MVYQGVYPSLYALLPTMVVYTPPAMLPYLHTLGTPCTYPGHSVLPVIAVPGILLRDDGALGSDLRIVRDNEAQRALLLPDV